MTNEQIEHMLPGPQWAAYRARLEQGQILTTRELAARLHVNPDRKRTWNIMFTIPKVTERNQQNEPG